MRPTPTVVLRTQFVGAAGELFALLQSRVAWDERLRARKTASFGESYDYSGMTYPKVAMLAEPEPVCGSSGSLPYMPRELQFEWLHAIPKVPDAGPRISLTFRLLVKAGR